MPTGAAPWREHMKITYTGQLAVTPVQLQKIEAQFAKIGKLLDGKEEREAHVSLKAERHLHHAEVTVNYHHHSLACEGSNADLFTAVHSAVDKLEQQAIKIRAKWRDTKRTAKAKAAAAPTVPAVAEVGTEEAAKKIFRVNHHEKRKPMTLDEAIMEIDARDYLVYRDSNTDRISVLLKRRDGHLDLVES
ncbi:MAG: ribosome-associated translation inhibitor RaiA, partial [Bryobacteraceae bacterium]